MTDSVRGILLVFLSQLSFSLMDCVIKVLSKDGLPTETLLFFRSFLALLILTPIVWIRGSLRSSISRIPLHFLRSTFGFLAMFCCFWALAVLPLAETSVLRSTTPLFVPLFALWWLKEEQSPHLVAILILGFLGILLVLKPGIAVFSPYSLVPLLAGLFTALAMVAIRRMTGIASSLEIIFYFSLLGTIAGSLLCWLGRWQAPVGTQWLWLMSMGVLATIGQFSLTYAHHFAKASTLSPFYYASPVMAAVFGQIFWHENLDSFAWCGAALIAISGVWVSHSVMKQRREEKYG